MLRYRLNRLGLPGFLLIIAGLSFCISPLAQGKNSVTFSAAFKTAVNKAMQQPDGKERTKLLILAMHNGTDEEVFFVFPLLFKPAILKAAESAHVCSSEINASMDNANAFISSTQSGRESFAEKHARKIRIDTNRLITCLDQHYANGYLRFPPPHSH
jgi:hypothetical protein